MNKIASAHDVFWLARHAHNTLDPLFKEARQYDPTIHFILNLNFAAEHPVYKADSLGLMAHWGKEGMFIYAPHLHTTADVDQQAAKVQAFIDAEQAALEAAADAAAEEAELGFLAADAEADAAYERQQERIRERADIERDEHYHDIELQNEMAGN